MLDRMVGQNCSFFTILIRVLLIPVVEMNGTYIFRLCSLRSFMSFLLWSSGPMFLVFLFFWISRDYFFGLGFSASFSSVINYGTVFVDLGCVPILLGYLVGSVDKELMDFKPKLNLELVIILILILLWESTTFVLLKLEDINIFAYSLPFRIIHCAFFSISLAIITNLSNAFCHSCGMDGNFNVTEMIDQAEDYWTKYRSLKKGFSPFIFVMYSIHTLNLVVETYR